MSTDLTDARWTPVLIIDGVENQRPDEVGGNVAISGWERSYPGDRDLMLKVNMEGNSPGRKHLPEQDYSQGSNPERKERPCCRIGCGQDAVSDQPLRDAADCNRWQGELQTFKALLDQKAAQGIDISAAQAKYAEADGALQSAEKSSSFVVQKGYVTTAQAAIAAGKALLDKASTQKVITDANGLIEQTDSMITFFKVNRSMGSDPRLQPIIVKRELAAGLLSKLMITTARGSTPRRW